MGTGSWDRLVNLSIFCVSVVDTYSVATRSLAYEETSRVFFYDLAEEMIDNNIDSRQTRPPSKRTGRSASLVPVRKRVEAHLFQTEDYRMVDALPTISKAGAESAK